MKSRILASCSAVALGVGVAGFASNASASTVYSYVSRSVPIGPTATVHATGISEGAYVGQIKLTGATGYSDEYVYCIDLYDDLAGHDTFNLNVISGISGGYDIPHAANTAGDALHLSAFQIQQIGALLANGFDGSSGATDNHSNQAYSAATQLAIWNVEYGPGDYTYGGGAVTLSSVSPNIVSDGSGPPAYSGIETDYNYLMGQVSSAGSGFLAQTYDVTLYQPDKTSSQDLTFASVHVNVNPVPLPAALPLFLSGLGVIGFAAHRRRRRASSAAA